MAKDKKSVLIYVDWISIFDELSDEEAGKLVKHLFRYVNDKNPEAPDRLTKLLFEPIKQTLKRDLVKYEKIREKNRDNVKVRWNKKDTTVYDRIPTDTKHTDIDSDSVIDNDKVKDIIKKANKSPDFIDSLLECFIKEHGSYEIIARGKERNAMSTILKKYKEKYPAATSEETIEGLRAYFKQCINIPDVWLMNNMSPSIIVSKFNEINKILKNGRNSKSGGASNEAIARIIAEKFGSDCGER